MLLDFHDRLLIGATTIDLLQSVGKTRLSAAEEVLHVALTARYYGRTARRYLRSERGEGVLPLLTRVDQLPAEGSRVSSDLELSTDHGDSDGLAALVAGNAIMLKPDTRLRWSRWPRWNCCATLACPDDVWQVVHGRVRCGGPRVDRRQRLCVLHRIDGHGTASACVRWLIGCSLELGGKNPW